jgi:tetratricopeptide (TPR) repeat protein
VRADWGRSNADVATLYWRARAVTGLALNHEKYTEAARLYEQVLDRAPGFPPAAAGLANMLAMRSCSPEGRSAQEDMRRAERLLNEATVAMPDDALTHFFKGQILRLQGRCEEAIDEYQIAIGLDRNFADAYGFLAACLLHVNKIDMAIAFADKAVRLDPANKGVGWSQLRIGAALLMSSRNAEAISWLQKARVVFAANQLTDDLSATYSWLAASYALKGDLALATTELARAQYVGRYPKSIETFCGPGHWCANADVKATLEGTYYSGLRLTGWSK